jgi:hypothetical protein
MSLFQKIALRLVFIALVLVLGNWIYSRWFYDDFLDEHGSLLLMQKDHSDADYLYYSASSEFSYHPNDTNTSRITKLIDEQTKASVKPVALAAHHAGIFAEVIQHLKTNEVKGLIVSLNYRSFSPEWLESHNENSLLQSKVLYGKRPALLNRLLMSLNAYDQVSNDEREKRFLEMFREWKLPYGAPKNTIESWCMVEKYGDWRQPKRQLADHYIKNFAFVLHENSPRMSDFDRIAQMANERNLNLIFIIIPENMEEAHELLGNDLTDLMNKNREFLRKRYHRPKQQQYVLDIMDILNDENFIDRKFPTEHYNFEGRKAVADTIASFLNSIEYDN